MPKESWRSQTWWSLPVYTGDVSGVCSALYEFGGMVVMHDPSGCNSTYNTHDEIRWTTMESLIFLSGLTELDAITGNDRKLIDDIVSAANQFHPAFIAIANSPVPWLIGTDFHAICSKVTSLTGIPAFHIETNAMHDYTKGAGQAFLELARMLIAPFRDDGKAELKSTCALRPETVSCPDGSGREKRHCSEKIRVNVLGATPLDYAVRSQVETLRMLLEREGFEVLSVWGIGDDLDNLRKADTADVNLVVSSTGIYTAKWMEENLKIPYTAGMPTGEFTKVLIQALRQAAISGQSSVPYLAFLNKPKAAGDMSSNGMRSAVTENSSFLQQDMEDHSSDFGENHNTGPGNECMRCVAGEPVTMGSIAAQKVLRDHEPCDLIPLTETDMGLIPSGTSIPKGEQQIMDTLRQYREVTGDPMLRSACAEDCHFIDLPHLALSGRMFLDQIPPLITASANDPGSM